MLKSLLDFKETFFNLVFNIRLQLFFHVKHFHVLTFEILQWMFLVVWIRVKEFIYWLVNFNITFHGIVILSTNIINHWQMVITNILTLSLHAVYCHLWEISPHWEIRIIGKVLYTILWLLIMTHYVLMGSFSQRHYIHLGLTVNSKHSIVLIELHCSIYWRHIIILWVLHLIR